MFLNWESFGWPALIGVLGYIGSRGVETAIGYFSNSATTIEARRNSDLERIEQVAFEIRDLACTYWSSSGGAEGQKRLTASITGRLSFLAAMIDELFKSHSDECRSAQEVLRRFHESCSEGDFGVIARDPEPERCQDIERFAYELVHRTASLRRNLPRGRN